MVVCAPSVSFFAQRPAKYLPFKRATAPYYLALLNCRGTQLDQVLKLPQNANEKTISSELFTVCQLQMDHSTSRLYMRTELCQASFLSASWEPPRKHSGPSNFVTSRLEPPWDMTVFGLFSPSPTLRQTNLEVEHPLFRMVVPIKMVTFSFQVSFPGDYIDNNILHPTTLDQSQYFSLLLIFHEPLLQADKCSK